MAQWYTLQIGLGQYTFPLHLLNFEDKEDAATAVKIAEKAARFGNGRYGVEFICPETRLAANKTMQRAREQLEIAGSNGILTITTRRIFIGGILFPYTVNQPIELPLAVFATPSPICVVYALAYAGLSYPRMQSDILEWLIAEKDGRPAHPSALSEHGRQLSHRLTSINERYNQAFYRLGLTVVLFRRFTNRIELENSQMRCSA